MSNLVDTLESRRWCNTTERVQVDALGDAFLPHQPPRSFAELSEVLFADRRVYQSGLKAPSFPLFLSPLLPFTLPRVSLILPPFTRAHGPTAK